MSQSKQNLGFVKGSLDTLALKRTTISAKDNSVQLIYGTGSCKSSIKKRPKKKLITQMLALALIDVAKENNETEWIKRYWNVWHCQNYLTTYNGRAYGHYCKNKCCAICVSIRKADMINRYKPTIEKWSDLHFLTLTVKSQPNTNLKKWMKGMNNAMELINDRCRQRYNRGKGPKLIGVRSLECNYNPIKKTYNPHFHVLCATKEIAEILKAEWLELWNRNYVKSNNKKDIMALHFLQKIRKVRNTEKDIIETIKYGAKIFTDPEMKKGKSKANHIIYAKALHSIYKSMDGLKLFVKFGFKLPKTESQSNTRLIIDYKEWKYEPKAANWVNMITGQVMTNYSPDWALEELLDKIDIQLN